MLGAAGLLGPFENPLVERPALLGNLGQVANPLARNQDGRPRLLLTQLNLRIEVAAISPPRNAALTPDP